MADLKLKYGESANIPVIDDGSLLFATDKKEIYLDTPAGRYQMSGNNNSIIQTQILTEELTEFNCTVTQVPKLAKLNIRFHLIPIDTETPNALGFDYLKNITTKEPWLQIQFGEEQTNLTEIFGTISITPMSKYLMFEYNINNKIIGTSKKTNNILLHELKNFVLYNTNKSKFKQESVVSVEEILYSENSFMKNYQQGGFRTDYSSAFIGNYWNNNTFIPEYDIKPKSCPKMFYGCDITDLKTILENNNVILDTSNSTSFTQFINTSKITALPTIDISKSTNSSSAFSTNTLKSIERLIISEATFFRANSAEYNGTFQGANNLETLIIDGVIAVGDVGDYNTKDRNAFDVSSCTKLSKDSLTSIMEHLSQDTIGLQINLSATAVNAAFGNNEKDKQTWKNLITKYATNWIIKDESNNSLKEIFN